MPKSCYVHVPFCDSICYYCDFCRYIYDENRLNQWAIMIKQEIQEIEFEKLDTLYFGGGTPSILNQDIFSMLANQFKPYISTNIEWTIEANPDSLTKEKLQFYKELGVNRISLGVQTFQESLLEKIGRRHTVHQIEDCIRWIMLMGFELSIDLMYGLPNQTLENLQNDLKKFVSLEIPHLSIYSLQIEKQSVFGRQNLLPCDEDLEADMYEMIESFLEDYGYIHYETSSYCLPGHHSRHNLAYWQDKDFYGIGCGASGKINHVRYDNTKNIVTYCKSGPNPSWIQTSLEDKAFESIMMGLRTIFGFSYHQWNLTYGFDFLKKYKNVLDKWVPTYLNIENDRIFPTKIGMEILNTILVDFLEID